MTHNKIIILLFILLSAKSVTATDPFDNTIFTFDNDIPTTDQLDQPILNQNSTAASVDGEVALDQPINTRYPITRYALQGVIKSMNQTRMMFVSSAENTKFLLSIKDCLGLNCAYVTDIDKRGVITFEDDEGIYRFQVGYAPYIVEQKITEETEEDGEDIIASEDQSEAEIENITEESVSEIQIAETKIQELETENFSLLSEVDFLTGSNEAFQDTIAVLEQNTVQLKENISQLQTELQNTLDSGNQTSSSDNEDILKLQEAEKNIINLEQKITEKEDEIKSLKIEIQNISSNTENDSDNENLQNTIKNLNLELNNKNDLLRESADKISSQVNQIQNLENQIKDLTNKDSNNDSGEGSDISQSETNNNEVPDETAEAQNIDSVDETDNETANNVNIDEENANNIMIAREDVNIREEPSPHSSIIGIVLKNAEVSVVDSVEGWYKISLDDNNIGYVYTPMLKAKD